MGTFVEIINAIGMKKNLFLICLTLASVGASAQNDGRLLSLEEAVEIATTENPAVKASEYEEMAAKRQRQAAIGLRMPKINAVGSYVYMGDDIALDANSLKEPIGTAAGNLISTGVQTGIISQQVAGLLQQALGSMAGLDWSYTLQDRSFGFVGGEVTVPIFLGGKINAANRAARIDESTAREHGVQTRNALISELGRTLLRPGPCLAGGGRAPAGGRRHTQAPERRHRPRGAGYTGQERASLCRIYDDAGRARAAECRVAALDDKGCVEQYARLEGGELRARLGNVRGGQYRGCGVLQVAGFEPQPAVESSIAQEGAGRAGRTPAALGVFPADSGNGRRNRL